jgi:glutamate--cysteine ligase catalytic subunit
MLLQPLKENKFVIPKSRYDTIDCYLANAEYNDREVLYDPEVFKQLTDGGIVSLAWEHSVVLVNIIVSDVLFQV